MSELFNVELLTFLLLYYTLDVFGVFYFLS